MISVLLIDNKQKADIYIFTKNKEGKIFYIKCCIVLRKRQDYWKKRIEILLHDQTWKAIGKSNNQNIASLLKNFKLV